MEESLTLLVKSLMVRVGVIYFMMVVRPHQLNVWPTTIIGIVPRMSKSPPMLQVKRRVGKLARSRCWSGQQWLHPAWGPLTLP